MAYTAGNTILDDHYNIFATGNADGSTNHAVANINTIWGTGTAGKGYGQSTVLSSVSAGGNVTATQWTDLFSRLTSIANHQGTSITALTNPSAGNTIDAKANLSANLSTCFTNRRNAAGVGSDITSGGSVTGTATWYTESLVTYTVTFGNNEKAEAYFNAGGTIRISSSRSGGTSNNKNTEWTDLCGDIGTVAISGGEGSAVISGTTYSGTDKIGGGGATPQTLNDNFGFHDSTSSNTVIFRQYADTSPYTANYIEITLADNGSGTLTVRVKYRDDAADTTSNPLGQAQTFDRVDGSLTTTLVLRQPSTTYISNVWSTPTISSSMTQS
jgi:hypothetical protein